MKHNTRFRFRKRFSTGLNIGIILKLYRRGKSFMASQTKTTNALNQASTGRQHDMDTQDQRASNLLTQGIINIYNLLLSFVLSLVFFTSCRRTVQILVDS